MRGIYAFSLALAIVLIFVLAFRAWYSDSIFSSHAISNYISAQRAAFLRHDVEYTLRQAIAFANECYIASGLSDQSCYSRYLTAWADGWAKDGIVFADLNVVPTVEGNLLASTLSENLRYSGIISGKIPAGFGVVSRIGG